MLFIQAWLQKWYSYFFFCTFCHKGKINWWWWRGWGWQCLSTTDGVIVGKLSAKCIYAPRIKNCCLLVVVFRVKLCSLLILHVSWCHNIKKNIILFCQCWSIVLFNVAKFVAYDLMASSHLWFCEKGTMRFTVSVLALHLERGLMFHWRCSLSVTPAGLDPVQD